MGYRTRRRGLTLGAPLLGAFLAFLDVTIVNVAFPSMRRSFEGAGLAELSWVLNGYNVAFAALLLPAGRLADSLGRRRVFVVGVLGFTVASAACSAAPSVGALVVGRAIQAAAAALMVATSLALVLPAFSEARRASGVAVFGAVAAVSAAVGPSLGGLLVEASDWRLVFLVNLPLGLLTVLLALRMETDATDRAGGELPDALGVVLSAGAMGLFALGIVQGNDWGWTSPGVIGSLGAGALLLVLFLWRSRSHPRPALELGLFRLPSLAAANAGTLVFAAAFYAMLLCNVLYLTQVWGYSTLTAGLALTPGPLTSAVVAAPAGRIADRFGQRIVVIPGVILFVAGIATFLLGVDPRPAWLLEWLPATILTGAGIGLAFPALASAAVDALPDKSFGVGSGVNAAGRQIGAVLGIALLVAVLGTPTGVEAPAAFDEGWTLIAVAGLATLPAALLLRPARRTR